MTSDLLERLEWSEQAVPLPELLTSRQLPLVVRVASGRYLSAGAGGTSGGGVHNTLLLTCGGRRSRIVAQSVKFKNNCRAVPVGPKLLLPDSFDGFFEILSEEGRSVRVIESVAELARRLPESCVAREPCKAYVSKSDEPAAITEKWRTIQPGETLVLVGQVPHEGGRAPPVFLHCLDEAGENVYLPLEKRVRFSAVAKEDNISGVHTVANLLSKRLPLNVRMVKGRVPEGARLGSTFAPEIRLHASFNEDVLVATSLHKDGVMIVMPPTAPLKLHVAENTADNDEVERLVEASAQAWAEAAERIHAFDVPLPCDVSRETTLKLGRVRRPPGLARVSSSMRSPPPAAGPLDPYDEIDHIYDYVRGLVPLRHNSKQAVRGRGAPGAGVAETTGGANGGSSPHPPPVQAIPSRKQSRAASSVHPAVFVADIGRSQPPPSSDRGLRQKRHRLTATTSARPVPTAQPKLTTLFAKCNNPKPKTRAPRHKRAFPLKTTGVYYPLPCSVKSPGPSPLFNIRYKSLNNLSTEFDTPNSSHSGGKTSGDSGDLAAAETRHLENKAKKLCRPRSMTSLLRPSAGAKLHPSADVQEARPQPAPRTSCTAAKKTTKYNKVGTLYL